MHEPQAPVTLAMRARGAVPDALVPTIVKVRAARKRRAPAAVAKARAEMEFLIGSINPDDLDRATAAYVERDVMRSEMRYHPKLICYQDVQNVDSFLKARASGRGVLVSFLHHGHYEGATATLGLYGGPVGVVVSPDMLAADAPTFLSQHVVAGTSTGNYPVNAGAGAKAMMKMLSDGAALTIATDVPGQTRLTFLGRERLGSSGAGRMAAATNSLVVCMYAHCEPDGKLWLQMSDPIEPRDFADPDDLLKVLVANQEEHVLAWPEGYHQPRLRWGVPDDAQPTGD